MDEALLPANAIPQAVWEGTFKLFGVEVKCYTLDGGERIIDHESMYRLLDAMERGTINAEDNMDVEAFARWRAGA